MKAIYLWALSVLLAVSLCARHQTASAQASPTELDKIYADESHCLLGPEIRSDKDNPISCFCRDAITDARYVHLTYVLPERDANLRGTVLSLEVLARQMCGENYDVHKTVFEADNWKWDGPQVVRT